jgi:hypothetical protein
MVVQLAIWQTREIIEFATMKAKSLPNAGQRRSFAGSHAA